MSDISREFRGVASRGIEVAMPEMRWAGTTISSPSWIEVVERDGRIYLQSGGGGLEVMGGAGITALWWSEETHRLCILCQFLLSRDRMLSTPMIVDSAPRLEVAGVFSVGSGPSALFDNPSISATFHLRQSAFLDDARVGAGEARIGVVDIRDDSEERRTHRFASTDPLRFPPVTVYLDQSRDLLIELEVELEMRRDGEGYFLFQPLEGDWRFWMRLPPWTPWRPSSERGLF